MCPRVISENDLPDHYNNGDWIADNKESNRKVEKVKIIIFYVFVEKFPLNGF